MRGGGAVSVFAAALDEHREHFEPWRALVVLDDPVMRRYVVAWSAALVTVLNQWPDDTSMPGLWACVQVDTRALGDLTGDSAQQVLARLRQAQGLQLIYPDGSVPAAVITLLTKKLQQITA